MGEERPTRWQKAKHDWPGVRGKRELASAVLGGLLAALALLLVNAPEAAVQQVIVVLAAAVGAAVLVPAAELYWSWLQAPMRLLTEDVAAVRRDIAAYLPHRQPRRRLSVRKGTLRSFLPVSSCSGSCRTNSGR